MGYVYIQRERREREREKERRDYKDSVHVTVETSESRIHSVGW